MSKNINSEDYCFRDIASEFIKECALSAATCSTDPFPNMGCKCASALLIVTYVAACVEGGKHFANHCAVEFLFKIHSWNSWSVC